MVKQTKLISTNIVCGCGEWCHRNVSRTLALYRFMIITSADSQSNSIWRLPAPQITTLDKIIALVSLWGDGLFIV